VEVLSPRAASYFTSLGPNVRLDASFFAPDFRNPRSLQYGLSIERQLNDSLVGNIAYVHNHTIRLERIRDVNLGRPDTQYGTMPPRHHPPPWDHLAPWNDLPRFKGELRVPNTINFSLFPTLDPFAKAVYYQLYLLSHGFKRDTCNVGLAKVSETCWLVGLLETDRPNEQ
jgi:hypothetical protein